MVLEPPLEDIRDVRHRGREAEPAQLPHDQCSAGRTVGVEIADRSLDELIGNVPDRVRQSPDSGEPQLVLWNPVPRRRGGVVVADLSWFRRDVLVGPPGSRLPRRGPAATKA